MKVNHEKHRQEDRKFDGYVIGKWGAVLIIAYYLWSEHRAHVIQFLPFVFILACPLMHFLIHRSHQRDRQHMNENSHSNESHDISKLEEKK